MCSIVTLVDGSRSQKKPGWQKEFRSCFPPPRRAEHLALLPLLLELPRSSDSEGFFCFEYPWPAWSRQGFHAMDRMPVNVR